MEKNKVKPKARFVYIKAKIIKYIMKIVLLLCLIALQHNNDYKIILISLTLTRIIITVYSKYSSFEIYCF